MFILDTYVKVELTPTPIRYITKSSLIGLLLFFYLHNEQEDEKKKMYLVVTAICCFIVGDFFMINGESKSFLVTGVFFFAIAKVLYSIRFLNKKDFNILKLIPFLLFCFTYMTSVMLLVYNNLGSYFLPVLVYLFIVMLTAQFAYLRKGEVNNSSYWLVLIGVILSMFSDSINILKEYYDPNIAYNNYTIMFFYGASQYFIVTGLVRENFQFELKKS